MCAEFSLFGGLADKYSSKIFELECDGRIKNEVLIGAFKGFLNDINTFNKTLNDQYHQKLDDFFVRCWDVCQYVSSKDNEREGYKTLGHGFVNAIHVSDLSNTFLASTVTQHTINIVVDCVTDFCVGEDNS